MEHLKLYEEIAQRTEGDIYIGVVGPVRTGKSTFIKRFMETLVIPNIENVYRRERARDELPQSGSGKTTLMYAMYGLYKQFASPVIYTTAYDLHTQFKHQLEKEASRYEEFLRAKYLFLDELGSEPERCQSYGTDYTPVQNLISYRYDRKLPTIVTTNLADDKILDRYGPRMMDRINEMFSILRFKGDSYRK